MANRFYVEFVHSQYSCYILTSQVSIQLLCPTKLLIIVIILDLKVKQLCNLMCSLVSVLHIYLILENMSTNQKKFPFSLLYLTLVTPCIIDPFLCCHLLYLIFYLVFGINIHVFYVQRKWEIKDSVLIYKVRTRKLWNRKTTLTQ